MPLHPFFSIILCTQEIDHSVQETLDSFFSQSCQDFEIIVQGVKADKETANALFKRYCSYEQKILADFSPDTGIYDAFNKALGHCRGQWIVFVGKGDFCLRADSLVMVKKILESLTPERTFCAFPIQFCFPSHAPIDVFEPSRTPAKDLHRGKMCLPHPGVFHRRTEKKPFFYDSSWKVAGDYEFLCRHITDENLGFGEYPWLGVIAGGISSAPLTRIHGQRETLDIARCYFPREMLLWPKMRIARSLVISWLMKMAPEKMGGVIADLPRFARLKPPLWSSIAWKAEGPLSALPAMPVIDLVVATCNSTTPLERLLESLQQQSYKNFVIHLVDHNNDEGVLDALLEQYKTLQIDHIYTQVRNASHARNLGLSRCEGDIIAFPDDDCVYDLHTLDHVKQAFEAHPDAGVIAGNLFHLSRRYDNAPVLETTRAKDVTLSRYNCFSHAGVSTLFVRCDVARRIEGFDETLCAAEGQTFACAEDIDYLLRLYNTGYRIVRSGRVTVRQQHPLATGLSPKQTAEAYAKGIMILCAKHGLPFWFCWLNILSSLAAISGDVWRYGTYGGAYRLRLFREHLRGMLKKRKA